MALREYILFVVAFIAVPIIFALTMKILWRGFNLQLPEKGRMGVWMLTLTLPVRLLRVLAAAIVYKMFGRKIHLTCIMFPGAIMTTYGVAPDESEGRFEGMLRFLINTLPLWLLPFVVWLVACLCHFGDVNLYKECCADEACCEAAWYLISLFRGALSLLYRLIADWHGGIYKFVVLLYLLVSLAVDFGISMQTVLKILPGICVFSSLGALVFLMPITSTWASSCLAKIIHFAFYIQSMVVVILLVGAMILGGIMVLKTMGGQSR